MDPSQWVNDAPDGILVSMGGDDLIGDQFAIYLDYEGSGLDATPFQGARGSVRASYLDLFALRDAVLPGSPSSEIATTRRSRTASLQFARALASAVARLQRL